MNAGHIVSLVSIGLDGRVITLEGLICSEQIMDQTVVKDGETERYRPKSRKTEERRPSSGLYPPLPDSLHHLIFTSVVVSLPLTRDSFRTNQAICVSTGQRPADLNGMRKADKVVKSTQSNHTPPRVLGRVGFHVEAFRSEITPFRFLETLRLT